MVSQSAIDVHILGIYEAAESPELWNSFISNLCVELHGNTALVVALDQNERPVLFSQYGVDAPAQAAYEQYFLAKDIVLQGFRGAGNSESGWVGCRTQLISDSALEKTEFYSDYMRPLQHFHQVGASVGRVDRYVFGGVSVLRSKRTGNFDVQDIEFLTLLRPHIRNAFFVGQKLTQLRAWKRSFDEVAQRLDIALITIDQNGVVTCLSPPAEAILRSSRGLRCSGDRLRATVSSEDAELQNLLSQTVCSSTQMKSRNPAQGCGSVLITHDGRKELQVTVIRSSEASQLFSSECRACVLLTDLNKPLVPRGDSLRHMFRLSHAESRLANLLLEGYSLKQAGEMLRVTDSSVRFMSKTIFRKTGVNGQSSLMRLMLRIQGFSGR